MICIYPKSLLLICTFFVLGGVVSSTAQTLAFTPDLNVKVYDQLGNEQSMPWAGGFNTPQFAMADLNHDGLQDLVVFETWMSIRTFLNIGSPGNPRYVYAPKYEANFPPITDYLSLVDYNCDGVADLFTQSGPYGFMVYTGYYNSDSELCFSFYKPLFYSNDSLTHGPANAYNNPTNIAAIVDVDGDGDLDFICYEILGFKLYWYRNMQVEYHLPCDSIVIKLWDECWGKVNQGTERAHTLGINCDQENSSLSHRSANKVTDGANTPCLFDYDDDGDYDYLDGNVKYSDMVFLLNGRIPYRPSGADSMVSQDTTWQKNGKLIELPSFPAAFNVDIDQDGKKDLLISPHTSGENYRVIWFYKNYTTPGHPSWVFQSDTFLVDQTIDIGTAAYPQLFDYNKDGKPDLFVGSDGYFQADQSKRSRISYYLNTSTPNNPSFSLQTKDFLGLNAQGFRGAAPAFGDLDNDGISDMVIGHTDGTLSFLKNSATSQNVTPQWNMTIGAMKDINNNTINVGGNAAPFIYDIDKDGKPDLVIGGNNGYMQYYRNMGTVAGQLSFKLINPVLGHAKVDPNYYSNNYSTPFIGKMDATGKDYILSGASSGLLYRFDGFQNADTGANVHFVMIDSMLDNINTTYNYYMASNPSQIYYEGYRTAPTVGDIDGDGTYEMIVGDILGGVKLYKQTLVTSTPNITNYQSDKLNIYPNPAKDYVNISFKASNMHSDMQLAIYNMDGKEVYKTLGPLSGNTIRVSVGSFLSGVYICVLQTANGNAFGRFAVLK